MPIELQIISGTLQGRNHRFDGDRVLIGDVDKADLRFEPVRDSGSRGKVAVLTLDDESGWQLANEGAGVWLVNQSPVAPGKSHRLRSDDLVRLSEMGPEFYFRLVAGPRGFAIPADVTRKVEETAAAVGQSNDSQAKVSSCVVKEDDFSDFVVLDVSAPDKTNVPAHGDELAALQSKTTPEGAVATAPHMDHGNAIAERGQTVVEIRPLPLSEQKTVLESDSQVRHVDELPKKPRRKIREFSARGRLIGVLVSGLFGLACAYCLGCYVGGAKNDVFHVFYKK